MELFQDFRAKLAPLVGTAALVVAVSGVVFAPSFMAEPSAVSQRIQAEGFGATAMVALRQ